MGWEHVLNKLSRGIKQEVEGSGRNRIREKRNGKKRGLERKKGKNEAGGHTATDGGERGAQRQLREFPPSLFTSTFSLM